MVEEAMKASTIKSACAETRTTLDLAAVLSEKGRQEAEELIGSVEGDILRRAGTGVYGAAVAEAANQQDRYAKLAEQSGGETATVRERLKDLLRTEERATREKKEFLTMLEAQAETYENALAEQDKKIAAITPRAGDDTEQDPKDDRSDAAVLSPYWLPEAVYDEALRWGKETAYAHTSRYTANARFLCRIRKQTNTALWAQPAATEEHTYRARRSPRSRASRRGRRT